jgi:hypothetical protein
MVPYDAEAQRLTGIVLNLSFDSLDDLKDNPRAIIQGFATVLIRTLVHTRGKELRQEVSVLWPPLE